MKEQFVDKILRAYSYIGKNISVTYAAMWSGSKDAITRLILSQPEAKIIWSLMPLKDAIDFSEFMIELTIKYERFITDIQSCGGEIDILVITKDDAF